MKFQKLLFLVLGSWGCLLFSSIQINAGVSVRNTMEYVSSSHRVRTVSSTYILDYQTSVYYKAGVDAILFDEYGDDDSGFEVNSLSATVHCDVQSTYLSFHRLDVIHFLRSNYVGGPGYYDPYGYSNGKEMPFHSSSDPEKLKESANPENDLSAASVDTAEEITPINKPQYTNFQDYLVAHRIIDGFVGMRPHIDEFSPTGLPVGTGGPILMRFVGVDLSPERRSGYIPRINVTGTGVTAVARPADVDYTGLQVEITVAEDAEIGDHQISITLPGLQNTTVTSNQLPFRVGDRSPVITDISEDQGDTGEVLQVTINGRGFGLNNQILFEGGGIGAAIQSQSSTQIVATFAIGDNAPPGDRGVKVKSFGRSGTGFILVPGVSDTSNTVPFTIVDNPVTVQLPNEIPLVEKYGSQSISVTVAGLTGTDKVKFRLRPIEGATGEARFDNDSNEIEKGNGAHTLVIKGITESSAANKMTIEATKTNSSTVINHKEFTVATITSLVFERINPTDIALDDNPGNGTPNSGEGQRIYPDKKSPTDGVDHSILRVKAQVSPDIPNKKVYFASFDLDDPSTDSEPVDSTGINGNDNNCYEVDRINHITNCVAVGNSKSGQLLNPNGDNCSAAMINGNVSKIECPVSGGNSSTNYKVTVQPGDNFAIAASLTSSTVFDNYQNFGGDLFDGNSLEVHISGQANSDNSPGIRTNMLTIWRKLHIEKDSMANVTTNHETGNIMVGGRVAPNQTITIQVDTNLAPSRFDNGRLVTGNKSFPVVANNANLINIRNTYSSALTIKTGAFDLYDDDDYNDNNIQVNGDEREAINEFAETFVHLLPVDGNYPDGSPRNIYASAYIVPEYDWAANRLYNQSNVTFRLNVEFSSTSTTQLSVVINEHRDSSSDESDNFWVSYLVFGYQGPFREDFDGEAVGSNGNIVNENAIEGVVLQNSDPCDCLNSPTCPVVTPAPIACTLVPRGGDGGVVFQETIQDLVNYFLNPPTVTPPIIPRQITDKNHTAVHELAHQFGILGDQKRTTFMLMDYPDYLAGSTTGPTLALHPEHINIIRKRVKSPGN